MCSLVLGSGSDGSVPLTFSAPFWRPGRPPFQKGEAASRTGSSRAQKTTQWCSAFCADNLERFSWSVQRGRDRTVVDAISAAVESMIEASNMPMSGTDERHSVYGVLQVYSSSSLDVIFTPAAASLSVILLLQMQFLVSA